MKLEVQERRVETLEKEVVLGVRENKIGCSRDESFEGARRVLVRDSKRCMVVDAFGLLLRIIL